MQQAGEPVFARAISNFMAEELAKEMKGLLSSKAAGPSKIPNEMLKRVIVAWPDRALCIKVSSTWKRSYFTKGLVIRTFTDLWIYVPIARRKRD